MESTSTTKSGELSDEQVVSMNHWPRKLFAAFALLVMAAITGSAVAGSRASPAYPNKPLRLIVPFPPGGGNDILARTVGQRLSEIVGQQVIVDNRGGAGGLIGATLAATAVPDGYTLFLGSLGNLAHNPALQTKLPYNPVSDFAAVMLLANSAFILAINPALPVRSVTDLIALAKSKPGTLNYASAGLGSSLHMTAELFKYATGTDIVHVAYKGGAPAITDLIAGQTQLIFSTMPPALPHVKSGKLYALGTTGATRAAAAPDVPTIAEAGVKGFEVQNWQGIVVPSKTLPAIIGKLHADLLTTLRSRGMSDSLATQGVEPAGGTPEKFAALIKSELEKYTAVVKAVHISVD